MVILAAVYVGVGRRPDSSGVDGGMSGMSGNVHIHGGEVGELQEACHVT